MINESRLIDLFLRLCSIDSPARHERPIVDYVKSYLSDALEAEIWEDEAGAAIGGNAGNLIVKVRGTKADAPRVFLSAHFDTVEPTPGIEIVERDGVFYSASDTILGADDYAGMAPAIEAVRSIQEAGESHGDIYLLLTVAEEIGLKGAANMDLSGVEVDFGYVLDTGPPVGSFVTRTGTHDRIDFTLLGRPAHAGKHPEQGINAIQILARAVVGMRLGRIEDELVANLGTVSGGTAVNVVCPSVKVRAEARGTDETKLDAQVAHMIERFQMAAREFGGQCQVDYERHYRSYHMPEDHLMVQLALQASEKLGLTPFTRTTLGGSDANVFNARGLPSIVVATGMSEIHTHDEFVSRKDLVDTARLARQILLDAATLER